LLTARLVTQDQRVSSALRQMMQTREACGRPNVDFEAFKGWSTFQGAISRQKLLRNQCACGDDEIYFNPSQFTFQLPLPFQLHFHVMGSFTFHSTSTPL